MRPSVSPRRSAATPPANRRTDRPAAADSRRNPQVNESSDNAPWYADGLCFTCTQCGNCCSGAPGYVWVTDEEMHAIAAELNMHPIEFMNRHTRRIGARRSLRERGNGDCEFLQQLDDGRRVCGIYASRPVQCRTWPFWQSNLKSRRVWDAAGRSCPGINQGEHHPLPVIQQALNRNQAAALDL